RQQRLDVDVDAEQIADGVVVFHSIETMDRGNATGIRLRVPCAIDVALEPGRDGVVRRAIRTWAAGRRHRAGAQLRDHLLPRLCVWSWRREIQALEIEPAGAKLRAVAADAVTVDHRSGRCAVLNRGRWRLIGAWAGRYPDAGQRLGDADGREGEDPESGGSAGRHPAHFTGRRGGTGQAGRAGQAGWAGQGQTGRKRRKRGRGATATAPLSVPGPP